MWKTVKLGDLCQNLDRLRKPITKKNRRSGIFPYYGASGVVDYVDDYLFDQKLVLVGEDGAKWGAGSKTSFIINGKSWVNNHVHVLKPYSEVVMHEWITYYLNSINLQPWTTGLTIEKLNQEKLSSIPIPHPPIEEQKKIVKKLDATFTEIDREVQNTNEIINLSNTNLKKIIDDKTKGNDNWIEFKVKDLGIVKTGNTPKSSEKENYGSEIPFVKPPHFNSDGSITITDVGLSKKGSKLSRSAPANSVLMVCIGATIGKVGINNIDVCFNQQINSVTSSDKFDPELIYWQMRGKRFQNDVIQNAGQATLPIINKSKWQNLSIFLPESPNEQIEIRTLLRKINTETENFINNKLQKIQNLNALKTAILKKALLQSEAA